MEDLVKQSADHMRNKQRKTLQVQDLCKCKFIVLCIDHCVVHTVTHTEAYDFLQELTETENER